MKSLKLVKSIIDGAMAHILHYSVMAGLIWIGMSMADINDYSFKNIFGLVIIARQIRVIITAPWNHHIKE